MRGIVIAVAVALSASAASAQENVSIPFAPGLPAHYAISETRTIGDDDAQHITHTTYSLELRAPSDGEGAFDATLTVVSTDGSGLNIGDENALLVDFPVLLSLEDDGGLRRVLNWEDVRAEWLRRRRRSEGSEDVDSPGWLNAGPERGAFFLGAPLSALEPCHKIDLPIGAPSTRTRETPAPPGVRVTRTARELRAVDREAGTARIRFERSDEVHLESASEPPIYSSSMQVECVVDLRSGVARSGTMEMTIASGSPTESSSTMRFEITVTPQ